MGVSEVFRTQIFETIRCDDHYSLFLLRCGQIYNFLSFKFGLFSYNLRELKILCFFYIKVSTEQPCQTTSNWPVFFPHWNIVRTQNFKKLIFCYKILLSILIYISYITSYITNFTSLIHENVHDGFVLCSLYVLGGNMLQLLSG